MLKHQARCNTRLIQRRGCQEIKQGNTILNLNKSLKHQKPPEGLNSVQERLTALNAVSNKKLQEKLDLMITPYNSGLIYKRHMEFLDHPTQYYAEYDHTARSSSEWKLLSNFVLNEDKDTFRKACQNINKGLYSEIEKISKWIKDKENKSQSDNASVGRIRKDSSTQVKRYNTPGIQKFKSIINKVLAGHIMRVQDKQMKEKMESQKSIRKSSDCSNLGTAFEILKSKKEKEMKQSKKDGSKKDVFNIEKLFRLATKARKNKQKDARHSLIMSGSFIQNSSTTALGDFPSSFKVPKPSRKAPINFTNVEIEQKCVERKFPQAFSQSMTSRDYKSGFSARNSSQNVSQCSILVKDELQDQRNVNKSCIETSRPDSVPSELLCKEIHKRELFMVRSGKHRSELATPVKLSKSYISCESMLSEIEEKKHERNCSLPNLINPPQNLKIQKQNSRKHSKLLRNSILVKFLQKSKNANQKASPRRSLAIDEIDLPRYSIYPKQPII
ncbi:unnamed protein product [Moneuplotes crassus]|uniref:Uncharacterized protein n=1 Tax=Euplotes crassus TaxID=5936 RepID=A0AAD1U3C4_EUPCR|nr:unnamed protein product [Moneuplotes crassus]